MQVWHSVTDHCRVDVFGSGGLEERTASARRPPAHAAGLGVGKVSEPLLANISKHAQASQVWIDIRRDDGMLKITVTDDGQGGTDPSQGTGLRGLERRLAAFDGVLAVSSPPGGPTVVTLGIPCPLPGQLIRR
jgi:glucose-6-phosphate-specific signal transduction histidine kinase